MEEIRSTKGAQWLSEKRKDSDQYADIVLMRGKREVVPFHTLKALTGGEWSTQNPADLPQRKNPGTD